MKAKAPLWTASVAAIFVFTALFSLSCLSQGGKTGIQAQPSPSPEVQAKPDDVHSLVSSGDIDALKGLLKSRQLVNSPDGNGNYPLHLAVSRGDAPLVEYLLSMGAELETKDSSGRTALKLAVDLGRPVLIELLAGKGASLYAKDSSGADPLGAAMLKDRSLVRSLLTAVNVCLPDPEGKTVLHRAAEAGLTEAVGAALSLDPDLNRKDPDGRTALDAALLRPQSVDCARVAELLAQRGAASSLADFSWFLRCARDGDYSSRRFDEGNSPLHEAVSRNQRGFVQFLVEKKADVNARNSAGLAPLHLAVRAGFVDCARILLSSGADPNVRDLFDNSPLLISMPPEKRRELLSLLLSAKADPDAKDRNGNAALHIACMLGYPEEETTLLLDAGAKVDSPNSEGNTPLMLAVRKGSAAQARLLLERKANLFAQNGKGESPLLAAFAKGAGAVAVLVGRGNANVRDDSGFTPLMLAARSQDDPAVLKYLLDSGAEADARSNSGDTALHIAVARGKRDFGELLLAAGADIFAANAQGDLPVTLALKGSDAPRDWIFTDATIRSRDGSGNSALHYAARLGLARVIPLIVQKGADVDARNGGGETALHAAVKADAPESVKSLLAQKASPRARDALGNSPLHLAVQWNASKSIALVAQSAEAQKLRNLAGKTPFQEACRKENFSFMALLLEKGADADARDGTGMTALMEAVQSGRTEVARYLVQKAKADASARDDSGNTALHYAVKARDADASKLLLDAGADIHAANSLLETPFLLAAKAGVESLPLVIEARTVNRQDQDGRGPLHRAILAAPDYAVAVSLLERGAKPSLRDKDGDTPLHAALRTGQYGIAAMIVKFGGDLFARNAAGESPLQIAMKKGEEALKASVGPDNSDVADYLGNTVLHAAAQAGDADAAFFFLAMGADKAARNLSGETPFDVAAKRGFTKAAEILK